MLDIMQQTYEEIDMPNLGLYNLKVEKTYMKWNSNVDYLTITFTSDIGEKRSCTISTNSSGYLKFEGVSISVLAKFWLFDFIIPCSHSLSSDSTLKSKNIGTS